MGLIPQEEEEPPVEFPYLEDGESEQVLHTQKYMIPLENFGYELAKNPKNGDWYLKNDSLSMRPVYVDKFADKSRKRLKRLNPPPSHCLVEFYFVSYQLLVSSPEYFMVMRACIETTSLSASSNIIAGLLPA